jgi:hypothetical protein
MKWFDAEEKYLKMLHDICIQLSKEYMDLYIVTHQFQTRLRLPSIILSSCSGVASFGSSGFGTHAQKYISLAVGIVNVGIAIIQTYESYLKVGDIVSKSLSCSQAFKKLADTIYCEIFIPLEDRNSTGITFLRDCFSRYQTILDQAPPIEFHGKHGNDTYQKAKNFAEKLSGSLRESRDSQPAINIIRSPLPTVTQLHNEHFTNPEQSFMDMKTIMRLNPISDETKQA